jgi:O-antigen ligase
MRSGLRSASFELRESALLLAASAGAGAIIATLPTLSAQLIAIGGAIASIISLVLIRLGAVLNPAWVIVTAVYLVDPMGYYFLRNGVALPPVIAIAMALAPFVVAAIVVDPDRLRRLVLLAPLVAVAGLAALSMLWTPSAGEGNAKLTLWVIAGLAPAAYVLILASGADKVGWSIIAAVGMVSAAGLIVFGTASMDYPGRPTLFEANPIWAGRAAFIAAMIVLFGPFPVWARVLLVPVGVVAGLMTLSAGPAIAFVLGALAGIAERLRSADRSDGRVALGWAGVVLSVAIALMLLLSGALNSLFGSAAVDPDVTSRAGYLEAALPLLLSSPAVGVGIGGFASLGLAAYPHNLVAEIAAELGLIGLALVGVWFLIALRGAARSPILVALLVQTALFTQFSGSLASNTEFWLFSALAASGLASGRRRTRDAHPARDLRPALVAR